eukprot:6286884-Lingulodinium_polyedra.AAC.1
MGDAKDTEELKKTDLTLWASMHSGLKEVRDVKEIQYLAKCLTELGADRQVQLAGLLAQRIREL